MSPTIRDVARTLDLFTLDQPIYNMAAQLARMLLALIAGEHFSPRQVKIQPKLLIRASTGG